MSIKNLLNERRFYNYEYVTLGKAMVIFQLSDPSFQVRPNIKKKQKAYSR